MANTCRHSAYENSSCSASATAFGDGFLLTIPALDCPSEERDIRALLQDLPIERLHFMLAKHQLFVQAQAHLRSTVVQRLSAHGFALAESPQPQASSYKRLGLAALLAAAAEAVHWWLDNPWLAGALALAAIFFGGLRTYQLGWQALKQRKLNVNSLMTVAVTGAFLIGQWAEAAMVMVLFTLADMIEAKTVDKARDSIAGLLSLTPQQALCWDGQQWLSTPVAEIRTGALLRVAPGESVPLDGVITDGHSTLDEAAFTGENIPVAKGIGDEVYAGTINITGSITLTATKTADSTALAKMIQLVEDAQQQQAPIQRWIDQFASIYTPVVFAIAVATVLLLPLLTQQTWLEAIYSALVMLVIACPCALVLAAPVTVAAGLAHGARQGILIKGGGFLEQARKVSTIAFDKTGTLTQGRHEIMHASAQEDAHLQLGAELAYRSQHPVSQAIAARYRDVNAHNVFSDVTDHVGGGISGSYAGQRYFLGNLPWLQTQVVMDAATEQHWLNEVKQLEVRGYSVSLFAHGTQILALYALQDQLRPAAASALAMLRSRPTALLLLTGDNADSAQLVANTVGIAKAFSRQTPEQKTQHINALQAQGEHVAMVGDGINDGLALVKADIGISLGQAGTDVAREAADITLMDNSLTKLPYLFALSDRTHRLVVQNISMAIGIKVLILLLAMAGLSNMWMAVLADVGVSLLVVANGLRALRLPRRQARRLAALQLGGR